MVRARSRKGQRPALQNRGQGTQIRLTSLRPGHPPMDIFPERRKRPVCPRFPSLQEIKELLHLVGNELPLNVKIEL